MRIIAISILIIGVCLRFAAQLRLSCNFSESMFKVPDRITKTGLYKYVRHPMYAASILIFFGIVMLSQKCGIMLLIYLFYKSRAIEEETMLNKTNAEYKNYMNVTGRFLPNLRKWKNA